MAQDSRHPYSLTILLCRRNKYLPAATQAHPAQKRWALAVALNLICTCTAQFAVDSLCSDMQATRTPGCTCFTVEQHLFSSRTLVSDIVFTMAGYHSNLTVGNCNQASCQREAGLHQGSHSSRLTPRLPAEFDRRIGHSPSYALIFWAPCDVT